MDHGDDAFTLTAVNREAMCVMGFLFDILDKIEDGGRVVLAKIGSLISGKKYRLPNLGRICICRFGCLFFRWFCLSVRLSWDAALSRIFLPALPFVHAYVLLLGLRHCSVGGISKLL